MQVNDWRFLVWLQIVKEAYPDHTQFEKNSPHYDPSSKKDNPKWFMVKIAWGEIHKVEKGYGWFQVKEYNTAESMRFWWCSETRMLVALPMVCKH